MLFEQFAAKIWKNCLLTFVSMPMILCDSMWAVDLTDVYTFLSRLKRQKKVELVKPVGKKWD